MATRADIEVNVKGLKKVQELSKLLDKVSGKVNQLNQRGGTKTGGKAEGLDRTKQLTSQSNVLNKIERTRDRINQLDVKGTRLAAIKGRLTRAEKAVKRGDLDAAKQILAASEKRITILSRESNANKKKLKDLQDQTKELERQNKAIEEAGRKIRRRRIADKRRVTEESPGFRLAQFRRNRTAQDKRIRRDALSSAAIGGAFPLLFGQGPLAAAGGAAGGFAGGILGGQAGFALSLVGTQIGSAISQLVSGTAELGKALGPFTQDVQAVTTALGLQGSVQEERIRQIERTQGKTAAFNAAMKIMGGRITQDGVDKLKRFGENTRLLGAQFTIAITKLQAFTAGIGNFVIKILGLEKKLREAANINIVRDFAATGDTQAKDLVTRRKALDDFGSNVTGSRKRFIKRDRKVIEDQLVADEQEFATKKKINIETQNLITKSKTLVEQKKEEDDINQRSLKLIKGGMNKELAKSIASLERQFDLDQKILELKALQAEENFRSAVENGKDKETQENLKDILQQSTVELGNHNKLRAEGVDLTKKLFTETDKVAEAFKQVGVAIGKDIKEGIKGLIKGTSTLSDLLNNVADKFLDVALNQALFGDILGAGGKKGGGLLGFLGFADGGRPPVNRPSIVGEKGPELFVPRSSGNIIPNNKLGGGNNTSVVVNVDASGSDVQGDEAAAKEIGTLISVAVQGELLKQQRPGGLLSR